MNPQLELQIKKTTVRKAVKTVFEEMPKVFGALDFCQKVRRYSQRHTMDGTILRRLRELRADGECVYKPKDSINAIYEKL